MLLQHSFKLGYGMWAFVHLGYGMGPVTTEISEGTPLESISTWKLLEGVCGHLVEVQLFHNAFCYTMLNKVSRSFAMVIQQLGSELRNAVSRTVHDSCAFLFV
jgi:hypothetical protein